MGLENRDYIRDSRPPSGYGYGGSPGGFGSSGNWAVKYLLMANIAVFILQLMTRAPGVRQLAGGITEWLSLNLSNLINPDVTQGFQIWRLVTYGFCHGSFEHILFNMFVLWMFGRTVEPIYGSREFLWFFLTGVVVSGVCHVVMQAVVGTPSGVIGASGGVMAVVFLTAMVFPRQKVLLFFIIPIELRVLAVLYAVVDILGALSPGSPVAHIAHLGGAGFGVAYHYFDWRLSGLWWVIRHKLRGFRLRMKSNVRVHRPSEPPAPSEKPREEPRDNDENIDRKVDRLLEKISREGEASLTDEERAFLAEASRRYRKP